MLKCYELGAAPATLASIPLEQPPVQEPEPEPEPQPERRPQCVDETSAQALFTQIDVDKNGVLSLDEFASWWSRRQLATGGSLDDAVMDSMREQWAALDLDGSGDLDRGEFEAVMTSLATSDWTEAFDEDRGKAYYYNRQTKQTRWQQPDGEAAVEDFMKANCLVLQPLRRPPPLETLRPPRRKEAASERTENPVARAAFDVETPRTTPRRSGTSRMRATTTAAGAFGQPPPRVAPRVAPRPGRSLPSRPVVPPRAGAATTHSGGDRI